MKFVHFAAILAFLIPAVQAEETAYTALRVVGRSQGKEALNRVLELRGRAGSPQPAVWKITLDEPRARGGVREIEVQRGKIISERTPASANTSGSPMNFSQLNLDSDGAFTVANQQAQKENVPFDHVDYLLHSGSGGGAPVWRLEISDAKLGRGGSIEIAADTGAILERNLNKPKAARPPENRPHAQDDDDDAPPPPPRQRAPAGGYSRPGEPFRGVDDFFHRLGKRFQKRGVQMENFFTGKSSKGGSGKYDDGR